MAQEIDSFVQSATAEVERLHRFIAGWFAGTEPSDRDRFEQNFSRRFAEGFVNIQPSGAILSREALTGAIWSGHGANREFSIAISDCALRWASPEGDRLLATYLEHQMGARNTKPSNNTRISTVLFGRAAGSGTLEWLHLHETAVL